MTKTAASGLGGARKGKAVSEDLRRRAVAAVLDEGMAVRAAARKFDVAAASVHRWLQRFRARGDVRADPPGGRPSLIASERARVLRLLEKRPEIGDRGLQATLAAEGIAVSLSTVKRFLKLNGLQRKQRRARRRGQSGSGANRTPSALARSSGGGQALFVGPFVGHRQFVPRDVEGHALQSVRGLRLQ